MSDEGDVADDAASDGGQTAVVTKSVTRPQRPTGKRSRQRAADAGDDVDVKQVSTEVEASEDESGKKDKKTSGAKGAAKGAKPGAKAKKPKKPGERSANPFVFVYTYLKQVVAEMRKVIWPNRKQMVTYTTRRTEGFEKYRKGTATATAYPEADKAKLSDTGK